MAIVEDQIPPNLVRRDRDVGQLNQILAEVVVVVLIVIFARVVVESGGHSGAKPKV